KSGFTTAPTPLVSPCHNALRSSNHTGFMAFYIKPTAFDLPLRRLPFVGGGIIGPKPAGIHHTVRTVIARPDHPVGDWIPRGGEITMRPQRVSRKCGRNGTLLGISALERQFGCVENVPAIGG